MASINGVSIKSLKTFASHDGCACLQGMVYLNGKRLGLWSQDAWGGPDRFEFRESVLDEQLNSYKETNRVKPEYKDIFNLEMFLYELVKLADREKEYKKSFKKGYQILAVAENTMKRKSWSMLNEDVLKKNLQTIMQEKDNGFDVAIYRSLSDFDVSTM